MTDLPLFAPLARARDPLTSYEAAEKVNVSHQQSIIVQALLTHGPMTTQELSRKLGIPRENFSARLRPMERAGMVREGGKRDGSIVWEAI